MNTIQDIGIGMGKYVPTYTVEDKGQEIENLLTNISKDLGRVANITDHKADLEFLLMIVSSYLMTKEANNLEEGAKVPAELFRENLLPQIEAMEDLVVEEIEDGD